MLCIAASLIALNGKDGLLVGGWAVCMIALSYKKTRQFIGGGDSRQCMGQGVGDLLPIQVLSGGLSPKLGSRSCLSLAHTGVEWGTLAHIGVKELFVDWKADLLL